MQTHISSIKVFLSYSHADMDEKEEIKRTLLSQMSELEILSDDDLQP